jgi:hypothetical protein
MLKDVPNWLVEMKVGLTLMRRVSGRERGVKKNPDYPYLNV